MPKIKYKFNKKDFHFFNNYDPNPIHKRKIGTGINGCLSAIHIISIINNVTWIKDVFAADKININFHKPLYPKKICEICYEEKKENLNRLITFEIWQNKQLTNSGYINQKLTKHNYGKN